jgi:hypothetical protein
MADNDEIQRLVQARKDAIERGDKNLGREIYHKLTTMGILGENIDADRVGQPVETTQAAAPEESAVPKPRKTRARKSKA